MASAIATSTSAAATRAFARETRGGLCKTLIARDFGSKTGGVARVSATARGASLGARRHVLVFRARVAGGTESRDDEGRCDGDDGEMHDESCQEVSRASSDAHELEKPPRGFQESRVSEKNTAGADAIILGEVSVTDGAGADGDAADAGGGVSERQRASGYAPDPALDIDWLDDPQYGCSSGQLWVNLIASVAATQNPKHARHFRAFLETSKADERLSSVSDQIASAWSSAHDTCAAELMYALDHPFRFGVVAIAAVAAVAAVRDRIAKTRAAKSLLEGAGVDLTNVRADHLETLEYLAAMRENDALGVGMEVCALKKIEMETKYLGVAALRDWREYYRRRGIDVAAKEDIAKIKAYVKHLRHLEGCFSGRDGMGREERERW